MPPTTPVETIQLHSMPRMNRVSMPAAPWPHSRACGLRRYGRWRRPRDWAACEGEGEDERHHHGHGERAGEIADEHQAPVAEHAADREPGRLSINASGTSMNTPVRRSKPSRYSMQKPTGNRQRAGERLAGLHVDRDGEGRRKRQNRSGHIGADHCVPRGHEDLRLAGVDHLGHEFGWSQIGHCQSFLLSISEFWLMWRRRRRRGAARCRFGQTVGECVSRQSFPFCVHAALDRKSSSLDVFRGMATTKPRRIS